jgi:hypothetical protein
LAGLLANLIFHEQADKSTINDFHALSILLYAHEIYNRWSMDYIFGNIQNRNRNWRIG